MDNVTVVATFTMILAPLLEPGRSTWTALGPVVTQTPRFLRSHRHGDGYAIHILIGAMHTFQSARNAHLSLLVHRLSCPESRVVPHATKLHRLSKGNPSSCGNAPDIRRRWPRAFICWITPQDFERNSETFRTARRKAGRQQREPGTAWGQDRSR